jgi:serine/threonine-protein kinase
VDVATIAETLDVAYLLEGSVRKSGNRVRITAQLIRTADSSHLWSESYDRELTDVFAVQDEISSAVVRQLRTTLLGGQPSAPGGAHVYSPRTAIDPEAYELYLRGRYEIWSWNKDNLARAEALFERAVARDPSFGDAWASLAETTVLRHEIHQVRDREAAYARATDAARRALASAPTSAEGHAALSHILWHERRWRLAEEEASRAVALNPSSAMGYEWLGMALTALGRLEEANAAFRQALALDPLSQTYYANAAAVLVNLGRFGDAETMIQRAAQLGQAGFTPFLWWTGLDVLLRVGRVDEAERWVERCAALGPRVELLVQILRARVLFAQGHKREARDLLAAIGSKIPPGAGLEVFMSGASFMIGEVDSGFYWLTRTTASADLLATARFLPEIQQVIADPRMQALLKETGLAGLPATGPGTPPAK